MFIPKDVVLVSFPFIVLCLLQNSAGDWHVGMLERKYNSSHSGILQYKFKLSQSVSLKADLFDYFLKITSFEWLLQNMAVCIQHVVELWEGRVGHATYKFWDWRSYWQCIARLPHPKVTASRNLRCLSKTCLLPTCLLGLNAGPNFMLLYS